MHSPDVRSIRSRTITLAGLPKKIGTHTLRSYHMSSISPASSTRKPGNDISPVTEPTSKRATLHHNIILHYHICTGPQPKRKASYSCRQALPACTTAVPQGLMESQVAPRYVSPWEILSSALIGAFGEGKGIPGTSESEIIHSTAAL
jgi:hypothetical protein